MSVVAFSQLGNELDKFVADSQKKMRLASYKTLTELAKQSREEIAKAYFKRFPDENGIRKNKGIPRQIVYDHNINKSIPNNPSIRIYATDKIDFMDKQEFGGDLTGGKKGANASVPFTASLKKMRSGTKGMKPKYSIKEVMSAVKKAMSPSLKGDGDEKRGHKKPKPFFMETKSGHTMVAIRTGRARKPIMPLYHFDRKRHFQERWGAIETIDKVVVSMTNKVWGEMLKKVLDKK